MTIVGAGPLPLNAAGGYGGRGCRKYCPGWGSHDDGVFSHWLLWFSNVGGVPWTTGTIKKYGRLRQVRKSQDKYDEFFFLAYQPDAMDARTKHLVALAASLGDGCQP